MAKTRLLLSNWNYTVLDCGQSYLFGSDLEMPCWLCIHSSGSAIICFHLWLLETLWTVVLSVHGISRHWKGSPCSFLRGDPHPRFSACWSISHFSSVLFFYPYVVSPGSLPWMPRLRVAVFPMHESGAVVARRSSGDPIRKLHIFRQHDFSR